MLFILLSLLLVGFAVEMASERFLVGYVYRKIEEINQRKKLAIDVGSIKVDYNVVTLESVALDAPKKITMDSVRVFIGLNPFASSFLKPTHIEVGAIYFKDRALRAKRFEWIKALRRDFMGQDQKQGLTSEAGDRRLPEWISLQAGTFLLGDDDGEHTRFEGVHAIVDLQKNELRWKASLVRMTPYLDEKDLDGSVILAEGAKMKLKIRSNLGKSKEEGWKILCDADQKSMHLTCNIDAGKLPGSIARRVQPMLGSSFSPSTIGSFSISEIGSEEYKINIDADVRGNIVEHKAFSISAIGPFDLGLKFDGVLNLKEKRIISQDFKVVMPVKGAAARGVGFDLRIDLKAPLFPSASNISGDVALDLARVACNDLLRSVPSGIAPELEGFTLGGDVSGSAFLKIEGERTDFTWGKNKINCVTVDQPEMYTQNYLESPFILERTMDAGQVIQIVVDPRSPTYTPIDAIPRFVLDTFVASEDTGFWFHKGIESGAIEQALERNAKEGRVAVGGSTITMQTVKNLFLSRDKTLARKAQEVFLAWNLEKTINKRRILEIYMNVVEFGPNLYGIGAASKRFFGVSPKDLNGLQAAYLASLLPAPIPRYIYFCRGSLTDNYKKLVDALLERMLTLGRISKENYLSAKESPLQFVDFESDLECNFLENQNKGKNIGHAGGP
jgi:hypothetical protein